MALQPENSVSTPTVSPARLWAEQLAMGMAILVGLLIFMALFHPKMLSVGAEVLGPNYLGVYGWASLVGIILQVIVHEVGTLLTARRLGLPLRFRSLALELMRRPFWSPCPGSRGGMRAWDWPAQ